MTTRYCVESEDCGGHGLGHDSHCDDADGTGETTEFALMTITEEDRKSNQRVHSSPLTGGRTGLTWKWCWEGLIYVLPVNDDSGSDGGDVHDAVAVLIVVEDKVD